MHRNHNICGLVPGHPVIVPVDTGVHVLGECAPSPLRGVERAVGVTFNKKNNKKKSLLCLLLEIHSMFLGACSFDLEVHTKSF